MPSSTLDKMLKCLIIGHINKVALPVARDEWTAQWEAKRDAGQEAFRLDEHSEVTHERVKDGSTVSDPDGLKEKQT